MNSVDQEAPHEITKEAVALMRRAASITGNEEIKFAASHIQSEYDRKQHLNAVAKEQLKVEETQKGKAILANMEQRKRFFSMRGLNRQKVSNSNQDNIQIQGEGLKRSFQQNRQPTGFQPKGGQDQQQQTGTRQRRFNPRIRTVDSQGNQINKEIKEDASSSSGTLSDVSSNGIGERTPPMISMVHVPSIEQKEQRPRHQVHPLQRTKSASTSDLNKGKNQNARKPFVRQYDDETSFAKLTLEEAHTLQSIADKTGNRQLKAISIRVQKIINENTPQPSNPTKERIETKENVVKGSEVDKKTKEGEEEEESVGFLSLINLIPIEIPQSSICELCETCNKEGSELQTTSSIEAKLPPPIDQEFLSGTSTY